ncbi:class I SAM-dependent DNA methyltransferase [Stenotrophomonas maltophilia]|uniref:class I SAM-dependent DNA methyltransferase n=1 Tax=Stenotrophomonas maltophilia TaxID=40324 RepID=UPI00131114B4|nr:class I SAM-dependent DNA methyltransferase [Stenotrophomonas maltophilia]MBA0276093.1 class I SAM-dependent DNA methyltransferase [Stenotrophomonas maltophilia]MBA0411292.1 class I SAM-dependent DNA methyltransferase [Stenotrophomonas maltophilia]MBA0496395.1 class I SAM-dependent DNA methyltransferase [Stenotrophomonas maltophilia]MBA0500611.1 class I SAM-dependent DNA methyltransferase [Stenotrophomonas maltophilia]MBA0505829.1 class I SAM-dependent DNA methyltransferase [Stenotrophomona
MNAVEIEEAIYELAQAPFDSAEFPFQFLAAFGNNEVTLKRLRKVGSGGTNLSDVPGAILQRNHIHLAVCERGKVRETFEALKASAKNSTYRIKLVLATDGESLEAEYLATGEPLACPYAELAEHFGYFLPFAGITTVQEIKENPIDVRATGRLNKLYVELLTHNPDWDTDERRSDMNHFMARLIFCFFAEDTDIFHGDSLFTRTVDRMSAPDGSNTDAVLGTLFTAMNLKSDDRPSAGLHGWALAFPYVNGGLFSGSTEVPRFTRAARSYLLRIGELNWRQINPDIFGSMIQAVADKEERGSLGMHYTSVPNILKVLNPLFLDDLRSHLESAEDNKTKLLNLRKRMAHIRVFDPACGSGNFLVIAYKEMRKIEAEINRRRGEEDRKSEIPINNFRGIELNDFPAEIARLALIIAEFQCDVLYRGQQQALATVLPLDSKNWITCGNALRIDWLSVCPPTGTEVNLQGDDLFTAPADQSEIDFENEGGETYICGNPPYKGGTEQDDQQKADMEALFGNVTDSFKSLDYVSGWFYKFARYARATQASCAFVSTSSITQGEQVARLWPLLLAEGLRIRFAYTPFKWRNLAAKNAGVTVIIIGLSERDTSNPLLFQSDDNDTITKREVANINAYLIPFRDIYVPALSKPLCPIGEIINGSKPADGGHLLMKADGARALVQAEPQTARYVRQFLGANDTIQGNLRYCLWITPEEAEQAMALAPIKARTDQVVEMRKKSGKALTKAGAATPYAFQQVRQTGEETVILVPRHSSETRPYLPVSLFPRGAIVADGAFAMLDAELWSFALLASKMHLVWVAAVCGRIKTDYRYSSTLGWNTFPVPVLTEQNRSDLEACAKDILLAREARYPATLADLYEPDDMPDDLRQAHERNDEVLERIYIGRRFRNDTERLEKLFDLYTKLTATPAKPKKGGRAK